MARAWGESRRPRPRPRQVRCRTVEQCGTRHFSPSCILASLNKSRAVMHTHVLVELS